MAERGSADLGAPKAPSQPLTSDATHYRRRVVITGIGAVSCNGIGAEALYDGLFQPAPTGERRVVDFDPSCWFDPKEARRTDRFAQFSVAVGSMAIEDAGILGSDPDRTGVIFGTGVGGLATLQEQITQLVERGPRRVSPFLVPMMMSNAGAAAISMRFGFRGPCQAVVTACASATHAIGDAFRLVAAGTCDVVITGGAEAPLESVGDTPAIGVVSFGQMTALSTSGISRPFDVRRDGFVIAEGAAGLVLEELEHAKARGAHIYCELIGAASTADAYHITAPAPEGAGARSCMELALADAKITAAQVTHINAHGTSTPLNDLAEAQAIAKIFGPEPPPLTSVKGVMGHSLGAAGGLEAVVVAMTFERGLIPLTAGLEQLDPEINLDVVTDEPRPFVPGPVLSNSFGFGGHNGCLVFGPYTDDRHEPR